MYYWPLVITASTPYAWVLTHGSFHAHAQKKKLKVWPNVQLLILYYQKLIPVVKNMVNYSSLTKDKTNAYDFEMADKKCGS